MSVVRNVLRTVLLALFFAFVVGFGIGTWLRCQMERPTHVIGRAMPLDPAIVTTRAR